MLARLPQVVLLKDGRTFQAEIPNITQKTELDFVFRDLDGVKGVRRFILVPLEDSPALVTDVLLPSRLRPDPKDRNRRIITPTARFPWKGKISDDRSLIQAVWKYEHEEKDVEVLGEEKQLVEEENPLERRKQRWAG